MRNKPYTKEEYNFVKENYGKITHEEIAEKLGRSKKAIDVFCSRNNFKAGAWHLNVKEIQDRINNTKRENSKKSFVKNGLHYFIRNGNRIQLHKHLWQKQHGLVPAGGKLIPIDGDTLNCDPDNWKLVCAVTGKPYVSNIRRKVTKSDGKYYTKPRMLTGVLKLFNEDDYDNSPNGWWMVRNEKNFGFGKRSSQSGIQPLSMPKQKSKKPKS